MELKDLYTIFKTSKGVCTDTRKIEKGVLFFALKGDNFNGNEFAQKAIEQGALLAIVDEEKFNTHPNCILVSSVLETLQLLANYHRRQFNIPFLAITGSNGKTTTKELIASVLMSTFKVHATKGNLNNHIGIPLTLLAIPIDTEIAVIEMGANHQKEIANYCTYVEPTHALITNIGKAHLEGFGGIEGIKSGKGELFDYMFENNGIVFLNSEDSVLMGMSKSSQPILYGRPTDFFYSELIQDSPFVSYKSPNGECVMSKLTGSYNYTNIVTALCIGKYFKVEESKANKAIADYTPENNRSQFVKKGTNEILLDAYNANPSSMKAAIENFNKLNNQNKVVVLGDMFELGEESENEHLVLGKLLSGCVFKDILLCGKNMKWAKESCSNSLYFETRSELEQHIKNTNLNNSLILIKGSRGMGLESVLNFIN